MKIEGWPECAACGKPVERVDSVKDPITQELVFAVHCHGAREIVRVPRIDLLKADGARFSRAFVGATLTRERLSVGCIGDDWQLEAERRAAVRFEAAKRVTVTRADGVMVVRVGSAVAWRCKAGNERKVSAGARRAADLVREKAIEADPTAFDGEIAETMAAWSRWTATAGTVASAGSGAPGG